MKILVLGGTRFAGRAFTAAALARGHQITLFHRGETGAGLFPEVEHLHGHRDGGLGALGDRRWDAVLDTCGYVPRVVGASADLLRDRVGQYVFVSTIAVYSDFSQPLDENSAVATVADPTNEDWQRGDYGGLKALCERRVLEVFGDRGTIVRPGLIVGPHDPTDRFGYWVRRIASGGEVLAPATPDRRVQFIDARDLAEFYLNLVEQRIGGTFNANGPADPLSMGAMLHTIRETVGGDARFTWADEPWLLAQGVTPWSDLPCWFALPSLQRVSSQWAILAGLRHRPLGDTVRDTHAWLRETGGPPHTAITAEREAELLARVPR